MTLPDLARFDRVAIDTETTGLTVKDRPVGLSWATPDGASGYAAWGHEGGGNTVSLDDVRAWARAELARTDLLKIGFNMPFDWRMLAYADVPLPWDARGTADASTACALLNEQEPSYSLDALAKKYVGVGKDSSYLYEWIAANFNVHGRSAGSHIWRAPADVVAPYAQADAERTLALYDKVRPMIAADDLEDVYALETQLLPIVVRMHLTGVRVDVERAQATKADLEAQLATAMARWEELAPGVNPMSTQQVADVFSANGLGHVVQQTEHGNPSVTKALLEATDHELAHLVLSIRELSKYAGTFVQAYIIDNADGDGIVRGEFHPLAVEYAPGKRYGTVSGRFSSGGALNLQNLPGDRYPDMKKLVRGLFIPYRPDLDWLKADYSQIEYRFLAHYAGGLLRRMYNEQPNVDFHQMLTDLIAQPEICNRRRTKNVNFAVVYGAGVKRAAATAGVSIAEMKTILALYHEKTEHTIERFGKLAIQRANARGFIVTWGKRKRRFTPVDVAVARGYKRAWVREGERYIDTHKAVNALLQGSAADLIKHAMVRVAELVDWRDTFLHLTVHDELDLSIPRGEAGTTFIRRMRDAMEDWPSVSVPVRVDIESGPSWGSTRAVEKDRPNFRAIDDDGGQPKQPGDAIVDPRPPGMARL